MRALTSEGQIDSRSNGFGRTSSTRVVHSVRRPSREKECGERYARTPESHVIASDHSVVLKLLRKGRHWVLVVSPTVALIVLY